MKNNRISSMANSKLLRRGLLAIFFLVCVVLLSLSGSRVSSQTSTPTPPPPPQAQNETKPVGQLVSEAKRAGRNFPLAEPFNPQTRSAAAAAASNRAVKAGTVLQLRQNALADLVNRKEQSLTLRLPTFGGAPVELELIQVNLFAPNFRVTTSDSQDAPVAVDPGVHYWGTIKDAEGSLAAISVFKDEVIGFYSSEKNGNFVLGKLGGNNPRRDHILYAEKDLLGSIPVDCDMPDYDALPADDFEPAPAAAVRCVKVFIEADFDLFQNKGSVDATVNYMTGVFNQSAALYNNEGIPISISQIFVWTTASPYNGGNSSTQLAQFQANRTSFNGDIAHLVDLQNQGGIAAGFNGLCNSNRSQSECYSGIFPFFENVPTYSWTVYVFTHEMGHLFGSRHTHACVWNGNNTAIDGCGQQAGFSEGSCGFGPIPGNGGTIMSYCHLNSVGINFSKGFGPQPGNVIRNRFNSVSCLGTCSDPSVFFSSSSYFVNESNGVATITVNRSGTVLPPVTVDYATSDGSAQQKGDYTLALGKLSFGTNETSKTFQVLITDDGHVEGNETLNLTLSNPTGGVTLGVPSSAVLTISSNDSVASQPIDDAQFFVRQHYRDFLNRDPDPDGLNFWTNEITSCGTDAQCIEIKRINVSAAFFLSIEFQQTGYLAYRFYNAALNRPNGLPRYLELMRDTQAVGRGIVVGATGWEAQLEANKVAYANEFVSRSEFTALYPTSLTPTQFVDSLYAHAGITPSAQDRQAAIDEFNNPSGARGRVLRRVADHPDLNSRETNRAFVLMEYFGYLRRNPDDPPDNNLDGYNFWLNKLNQFNGNFVQAEMVKAFITSPEYRQRFGL